MNLEEIHRLLEAYLDGTIGEDEARRLAAAIRAGGDEAAAIRLQLEFTGMLGQALEGTDDEAFARSLEERLRAERGEADFVRSLERRASARASWRAARRRAAARRGTPALAFAAAGLLAALAAVLAFWTFGSRPPVEPPRGLDGGPPPRTAMDREEPVPPEPETPPEAPAPLEPPVPPSVPESPRPMPAPVAPPPETVPVPEPDPSPPLPPEVTRPQPAVALEGVEGGVLVAAGAERAVARKGQEVLPGQGVIVPDAGRAAVLFADGTRLGARGGTSIREIQDAEPRARRVVLTRGILAAEVASQPAERPMVFVTPHAEARVLGTSLRLTVTPALTLLEVREGRVRLSREGRHSDVAAGQFAMARAGFPLAARPAHPDEIVLRPLEAQLEGNEWALARDPRSSSGLALEAIRAPYRPVAHVEKRPAFAAFSFYASAEKEYRLWVRAASVATGDPWTRDMVTVEPRQARLSRKSPFFGTAPTNAYVLDGISASTGYSWAGSRAEEGREAPPPLVVRFEETGLQTLRLYTVHRSVRIDAVWLSATQKARPAAKQPPPSE